MSPIFIPGRRLQGYGKGETQNMGSSHLMGDSSWTIVSLNAHCWLGKRLQCPLFSLLLVSSLPHLWVLGIELRALGFLSKYLYPLNCLGGDFINDHILLLVHFFMLFVKASEGWERFPELRRGNSSHTGLHQGSGSLVFSFLSWSINGARRQLQSAPFG